MHSFTFNGHSSDEFGIRIERFPDLNRSARKYKSASVAGRNGNIYQFQNAWEEVTVSYQIFAGERQEGAAVADFTDIVEWLNSADDYAVLTDSYDPEHYRLAVFVDEMEIESEWHTFGKATVRFRCRPQRYLVQNPISVNDGDTITNATKHTALPIITLTGSEIVTSMLDLEKSYGVTLDSVSYNWNSDWTNYIAFMYASGSSTISVTTYREAGTPASEGGSLISHVNSTGTLRFTPFMWSIYNVGIGRGMALIPNTDYTISCTTTSGSSKIWVGFFETDGNKKYYSSAEASRDGAGQLSLTFHVPSNCTNTLFIFYRTDNTTGTFSSIMLASGTEVVPFQPYATEATETFTIGNTTLQFTTSGFDTAVIDCEKENFTVDGVNYNAKSTIFDQYGNYSEEYLKLDKGDNTVTYTSDITSVMIEPRFWEL